MHKRALSAWFQVGLHHSLPCAYALCGTVRGDPVRNSCTGDLVSHLYRRRCIRCAIALDTRHAAQHRRTYLAGAPDFDATVVITDYAQPLDHPVTGLEFRAQLPLADQLAAQLDNTLAAAPGDLPDMLLSVPLSPTHLHSHGYNQAWEVARRIAHRLDIPTHTGALQRVRDNIVQATLDRVEWLANLRGAFVVAGPARIAGHHIGVVDDVMTTGATLDKITTQLKRTGTARVTNVVALRTP